MKKARDLIACLFRLSLFLAEALVFLSDWRAVFAYIRQTSRGLIISKKPKKANVHSRGQEEAGNRPCKKYSFT